MADWIPTLDDLLPSNDGNYEPPANLADLFEFGSPLFECADIAKFSTNDLTPEERHGFRLGWEARLFDVCLKAGKPFFLHVHPENAMRFQVRAEAFNRTVEVGEANILGVTLTVSKHKS